MLAAPRAAVSLLFSLLLAASPALGAGFVLRPGPSAAAGGAPAAEASAASVRAWTGALVSFLRSPSPDLDAVKGAALALAAIDPASPGARQALAPLAAALQAELPAALAAPRPETATEAALRAAQLKLKVLNFPAVRAWLPESSQEAVGAAAWAYNKVLWERKGRSVGEMSGAIAARLAAPRGRDQAPPAAGPAADGPALEVEVLSGDAAKISADAVVATVDEAGACGSGLHSAIESAGGPCYRRALERAPRLEEGGTLLVKPRGRRRSPFKSVLYLSDQRRRPLELVVRDGLRAADAAGLSSVVLPAPRTGSVFGAVERGYDEIARALRRGVDLFLAEARSSLRRVSIAVRNDSALAGRIQAAFAAPAAGERERSLRHDLRRTRLSGAGYTLSPRPAAVADRRSPVYASLLKPWSLSHLLTPHNPVLIGEVKDRAAFSSAMPSVLNMPIKMQGSDVRVPAELEPMREFLQKVLDHEAAVNPEYGEFYAYLTVDQSEVAPGTTHRRPGVHIDGVQGARYPVKLPPEHIYSASDALGTVFYDQAFDLTGLDPARQHVHAELERQAREENARRVPDYRIAFWDSYSVHRADVAREPLRRTFVRVEFSRKKYDSLGDTHNPLFDYDWKPVARPIPAELDDSPLARGPAAAAGGPEAPVRGYRPELRALKAGAPHTVKDLDAYLRDNLGRAAVRAAKAGRAPFLITVGEGREALERARALGWTLGAKVQKKEGFHQVFRARDPSGREGFVLQRVNGEDRVLHVQSLLKLAGAPASRVLTAGGSRSWRARYKAVFDKLGYQPDLVVYGFANTAIDAALLRNAFKNGRHFAALKRHYAAKRAAIAGAGDPSAAHDLDGLSMQVLELADGRRIWLLHCMFGDLARDLVGAALDHGAKNLAFIGSAGSLEDGARMGELVVPRTYLRSDGRRVSLERLPDIPGLERRGTYQRVSTPNLGTKAWTARARRRGVDLIESELGHVLDELELHPGARVHAALVIAEATFGPDGRDMTEWGLSDLRALIPALSRVLDASLGARDEDYVVKSFRTVPLGG